MNIMDQHLAWMIPGKRRFKLLQRTLILHKEGLVRGLKWGGIVFSRSSNRNDTLFLVHVQHYCDMYIHICSNKDMGSRGSELWSTV